MLKTTRDFTNPFSLAITGAAVLCLVVYILIAPKPAADAQLAPPPPQGPSAEEQVAAARAVDPTAYTYTGEPRSTWSAASISEFDPAASIEPYDMNQYMAIVASFEQPKPLIFGVKYRQGRWNLRVGRIGIPRAAQIAQILGPESALMSIQTGGEYENTLVLVEGIDITAYAEDSKLTLPLMKVQDTFEYVTVLGATKTVFRLVPFDYLPWLGSYPLTAFIN